MLTRYATALATLGLVLAASPGIGQTPPPVPTQEGVDYLGRGPVHEAYAQPLDPEPPAAVAVPQEPPAPIEEQIPESRPTGENVHWVPGYWQWDDERRTFIWVSGIWRQPPPGLKWAPGAYVRVVSGWQRAPGLWVGENTADVAYHAPPPAPLMESPAPPPDDTSIWVPGCWIYRNGGLRWRPGYYVAYYPGWIWVPSHWCWTPAGYIFVSGYWDFPLARRGWLYAPVVFRPGFRFGAGFRLAPGYIVPSSFLVTALFVRGGWGHYYFGDYYRASGFTAFVNFRVGGFGYDPIFGYYRRANAARVREVQSLYADRAAGRAPLPPRTFRQQTTVLRGATTAEARNLTVFARPGAISTRVEHITTQERAVLQNHVVGTRDAVRQRRETETTVVHTATRPVARGDAPHVAPLPAARAYRAARSTKPHATPPHPSEPPARNEPRKSR